MLDKTIKIAYFINVAIPTSHNLHSTITERVQKCVYSLERGASKDMATESGLYNTTSAIHSGYHSKQITQQFQRAYSPPRSIYSNVEISNT